VILIVTGGSRGIGAAVCLLAAGCGYDVVINYASDRVAADDVAGRVRSLGRQALTVRGDVSVEEDVLALFDAADELGPLAGVVNNAAITGNTPGRLDEQSAETVRRVLDVNVAGVFLCCREAVRRMSSRYGGSGGVIVNISSTAARTGAAEAQWREAPPPGAVVG
jgi:NAD(P)-dependent dehydrogenase (short-subunit alcohol dehydrogenase family)